VEQLFADTDLTDGLNEPQKAAVLHRGGPLLILAGALRLYLSRRL